ncbi:MAG TPA: thioesterase domain-containing protein, partial [Candidatus Aquilonibacter sp.]
DMGLDDNFYAFGGDSLRAMRLIARLRDAFQVDLGVRDLVAAPTVAGLTVALTALIRDPARSSERVRALRTTGTGAPIYFMHGDLVGGGSYCEELARHIDVDHPFYAVAPHGTDGTVPPMSIEAMARENVAAILATHPGGPLRLGGFCNGGIVAYEMACTLERAGVPVERVAIVDGVASNAGRSRFAAGLRAAIRQALERTGIRRPPAPWLVSGACSWDAWHEQLVEHWYVVLGRYIPQRYAGSVSLLWSDERAASADEVTAQWRVVAPAARADRISGTHLTSVTRHLIATCGALAAHLGAPSESTDTQR